MREDVRRAVRAALLALIPAAAVVLLGSLVWANRRFYLVSVMVLVLALVPMLLRFERRAPQFRRWYCASPPCQKGAREFRQCLSSFLSSRG